MIERIIRASAAKPVLSLTLTICAIAMGAASYGSLRRDVFPDLSAPIFNVIFQNPAMGAEELEAGIAIPAETALAGLPGTRRVRSVSQLGVAQVTVEFKPDEDYFRARQLVSERVQQVAASLPSGTRAPLLSSLTGRLNEIMEIIITAAPGAADLMALRDLAEFDLRNRVLAVPGVAAVERLGGYLRQFQVLLDPDRMVARQVGLEDVLHALEGASTSAAGGVVALGGIEWSVQAHGRAATATDIGKVVVAVRGDTPVLVNDIAEVREAPAFRRGLAHVLEGEVVSCRIVKQFGADTVETAARVRVALADIQRALPEGVAVRVVYDQADLVQSALGGVGRALLLGAVFVILVLFVALGNWRAAMLVTLTLPASVAIALLAMKHVGVGLNTMTLGGLAIAIGLLVDASIIVVENILHRAAGAASAADYGERAIAAAAEVGRPIAFATAILIAVFTPLLSLHGIEGRMYAPLAMAVVTALFASLAIALTSTPIIAAAWLRAPTGTGGADTPTIRSVKAIYRPALRWCLRHRALTLGIGGAITLPAVITGLNLGADFMPELDEGAILLQTIAPPEAQLAEVDRLNHKVEDVLRTFPEVSEVIRRTGRSEETEDPMPHTVSDVLVLLRPDRERSMDALSGAMREALEDVPGMTTVFTTPLGMRIDEGLAGSPADLSVRVFGPDLDVLTSLAAAIEEVMGTVAGVADVRAEKLTGLPQIRVELDRPGLARVGLTPGDAVRAVNIGLAGEIVGDIWRGQRRYDLIVKLPDERRNSPERLAMMLVDGHDGARIPLRQVARIGFDAGPGAVRREAGSRRIAVEASVSGRDLASTAAAVRARVTGEVKMPTGYFFDIGGRVETQAQAAGALLMAIGVAAVAVFLLLYLALGRVGDAAVILGTLPMAFAGGIGALWLAGETWNVSSLVGLIGLFGIAVQNGLVLISQTRALLATGMPYHDALFEACVGRVRPKLMTAACAILGLLPLIALPFHGTEIERPLAIVMCGGLVTSTLFTLLALPAFHALMAVGGRRSGHIGP